MESERKNELYRLWCEETNEPETREWRTELNNEEQELVAQWEAGYFKAVDQQIARSLLRDQIRERFQRKDIAELEVVGKRYRLRLKTGELYIASLTQDYQLQLDSVDEAC